MFGCAGAQSRCRPLPASTARWLSRASRNRCGPAEFGRAGFRKGAAGEAVMRAPVMEPEERPHDSSECPQHWRPGAFPVTGSSLDGAGMMARRLERKASLGRGGAPRQGGAWKPGARAGWPACIRAPEYGRRLCRTRKRGLILALGGQEGRDQAGCGRLQRPGQRREPGGAAEAGAQAVPVGPGQMTTLGGAAKAPTCGAGSQRGPRCSRARAETPAERPIAHGS